MKFEVVEKKRAVARFFYKFEVGEQKRAVARFL
jgi:hypothetical protein